MATEIRIPRSKKDLRIRHNKALSNNIVQNPTLSEKSIFLHDLTGAPLHDIRRLSVKDVDKLYRLSMLSFAGFKLNSEPPKEIVLDGKTFELVNPHKIASGWHIDWDTISNDKDPIKWACMYYFPKGKLYGEADENGNILNPSSSRYELFKEHFPLQTFLECRAFFLKKYERSIRLSAAKIKGEKMGTKIRSQLRGMLGRKQSTH